MNKYVKQIQELESIVYQNMGKCLQITIDTVQNTEQQLNRDESENAVWRDELGAIRYRISILLEAFNPELIYDIKILKRLDTILKDWCEDKEHLLSLKIALITANIGNFDIVREIPKQTVSFDHFYYTGENLYFPGHTIDNRLKAKIPKIIPHKIPELQDYGYYIWVDANVQITSNKFVELFIDSTTDFTISNHPSRKTIYEEADFIISQLKGDSRYLKARYEINSIKKEMEHINAYFKNVNELYYCGVFGRFNSSKINNMCEQWYLDNVLFTNFDQLNFVSNATKSHISINTINFGGTFNKTNYFTVNKHNRLA